MTSRSHWEARLILRSSHHCGSKEDGGGIEWMDWVESRHPRPTSARPPASQTCGHQRMARRKMNPAAMAPQPTPM